MRLPHLALWRGLGRAAPAYSPRYRRECAVTVLEEYDRLATRLRHSHRLYRSRRKDMASVQGSSFPQEAFRSPPGLLREPRRDRRKETHNPEVNLQSLITERSLRTYYRRSRPTAEQKCNIPQAALFDAGRQTAGVIQAQNIPIETHGRRE